MTKTPKRWHRIDDYHQVHQVMTVTQCIPAEQVCNRKSPLLCARVDEIRAMLHDWRYLRQELPESARLNGGFRKSFRQDHIYTTTGVLEQKRCPIPQQSCQG